MTPSEPLLRFVRPLPGTVGETQRVCHVVPADRDAAAPPDVLVAYCRVQLSRERVEFLSQVQGQPCFLCLVRVLAPETVDR
ncbi:hypothetical protein GCM10009676_13630 [Prauserella halophila]|uniref:Uncharacterized protein n=1 Tax=Prauserella halophila TaxID=185641 RepID=A0ABN1W2A2_9PSEU|nr:hypothetical protein [Prauserella halophila]MCP2236423.1 hypothetical protein [Prauserella halophila]